jgi:proline iminopeptidase
LKDQPKTDASLREVDIRSEEVTLHARVRGSGKAALVLLHGGPGLSHHYMIPLEKVATAKLRVVNFDQRGVGGSTRPSDDSYGMDRYVADLDAVRAWLGLDAIHILGHSWGGLIAQAYAAEHPDRVASLVLVSSMAPWLEANQPGSERLGQRIAELTQQGKIPRPTPPSDDDDDCSSSTLAMLPAYLGDPDQPVPEALRATACVTSVYRATVAALGNYDFRDGLGGFEAPAVVFMGERDPFGVEIARATVDSMPSSFAYVQSLSEIGHFPWLETDAFVRDLQEFLSTVL